MLAHSEWYEAVQESGEILFEQLLDFDGDGIQEVIIGTNSMERKEAILHIGEYNIEKEEWSSLHKETHRFLMFKEPRYYNALVGIRFEIGGEGEVYIKKGIMRKLHANPKYVNPACERAYTIFKTLRQNDWLLRIDVYDKRDIDKVSNQLEIGKPKETVKKKYIFEKDKITHYELYWDLNETTWPIEKIVKEVVLADIGGLNSLASAVFLLHAKEHVFYHLYDDRGLDVVAKDKEILRPIYEKYKDWILEYDRESPHAALPRSGAYGKLCAELVAHNQSASSRFLVIRKPLRKILCI